MDTADGDGITVNAGPTNGVIGNLITGSSSQGFVVTAAGATGNVFTNNTVTGNGVGIPSGLAQSTGITLRSGAAATLLDRKSSTIRLAGGDIAIRQVWRQALALLDDAFDGEAPLSKFPAFARVSARHITVVRQMIEKNVNTVAAHGVGRYFDAVGALGLARVESRFEGQVALEWNLAADSAEDGAYGFAVGGGSEPAEIDLRPAIRTLAGQLIEGVSPSVVSARFHNTLAAATAEAVRSAMGKAGRLPVVLTGGVFQNALLVERVLRAVGPGVQVVRHEAVPPGDGGLALGQAVIANAVVQSGRQVVSEGVCV